MTVGIEVQNIITEIGASSFLHSFFSTIAYRLENGKWGSRFPLMMNELYHGRLAKEKSAATLMELTVIKNELAMFGPDQVVWDIEDLNAKPPWGDNISTDITDLSNYFVTSTGRDLIEAIKENLEAAQELDADITIVNY